MFAKSVELSNWRNIKSAKVELSKGVNLFYGKNAQGKTNFLESVYLFSQAKSFRTSKDKDLCAFGQDEAKADLVFERDGRENRLSASFFGDGRRKEMKVNGFAVKKNTEFQGNFYTVLFAPEHLNLVKEGPSERRRFLDLAISPLKARYASALDEYEKILTHKNALLKDIYRFPQLRDTLPVWNEKQAATGAYISFLRASYVEKLKEPARQEHLEISRGKEELALCYEGFAKDPSVYKTLDGCKAALLELLESLAEEELRAGMSICGPQRDDMEILLNGAPLRSFGSQGQQRSAVLSLKLAEGRTVFDTVGEHPVFLLDDVMSELDPYRRSFIINKIKDRQVIITACDRRKYAACEDMACFFVKNGEIERK